MENEISKAKAAFINNESLILSNINYLLPELSKLQEYTNKDELLIFEDIFDKIQPEMTVHEVASLLGKCDRDELSFQDENIAQSFLESLHLFCDIEAKIRFSIWPSGLNAPHHFSKLLLTPNVQSIISKEEILCILAILADPKGLNLRNIATHGFSFDTRLSLPLLRNLSAKILPKLPEYVPPNFDFLYELSLLRYHSFRLNISSSLKNNDFSISQFSLFSNTNIFPLLDNSRLKSLQLSYKLYNESHFVDSLLLLFPILEHSIRRAAVSIMDLPIDRLCASPDEHFLSIPEALEAFPDPFKNMVTDILFMPNGPRVRDRIMHGAIRTIPREFAFCIFSIFEKFNQFYNMNNLNNSITNNNNSNYNNDDNSNNLNNNTNSNNNIDNNDCSSITQIHRERNNDQNDDDDDPIININCTDRANSSSIMDPFKWGYAFHPSRVLEFEIYEACFTNQSENETETNATTTKNNEEEEKEDIDDNELAFSFKFGVDMFKIYNSQSFERLIECVSSLRQIKNSWKDSTVRNIFESRRFNKFICSCVLIFTTRTVKSGTLQHLNGLVHSIIKFEAQNDVARFKKACETRIKAIKSYLPFIPKESKCTFSEIEKWIYDDDIFKQAVKGVIEKSSS